MTQAGSRNTYVISSWLFLRLLGSTYFLAFLSAHLQVQGLLGADGIVPVHNTLQAFAQKSSLAWLQHPSIFWLDSSDWLLSCVTTGGIALSLFVVLDFCTWPALLAAWIFYLSLHSVGSVFFAFQWDTLLLEATLPAFFLPLTMPCPGTASTASTARPISPFASALVFIYRWLLFRVMFCSGLVKLAKGCLVWSNMTALAYYYETQLLPSPLALWAHNLPLWFQVACTAGTFVIELGAPFLIFSGRWARLVAAQEARKEAAGRALVSYSGIL